MHFFIKRPVDLANSNLNLSHQRSTYLFNKSRYLARRRLYGSHHSAANQRNYYRYYDHGVHPPLYYVIMHVWHRFSALRSE